MNITHEIELLAPAGSYEAFEAALGAGADAGLHAPATLGAHHHLWRRRGRGDVRVPAQRHLAARLPDPDLGPVPGRLADRLGPCQHGCLAF